jgi:hypothetical protein
VKNRLPLTLSTVALVVAIAGTPVSEGALHVVRMALFAKNAGAVNGIKASRTPRPGQLVPLNARGHFSSSVLAIPRGPQGPQGPPGQTGPQGPQGLSATEYKELTTAQVDPSSPTEIRAFIPTGSASPKCLVTLAESGTAAATGTTVYCGTRNYNGVDGVYVHIFLPSSVPIPAAPVFLLAVTVYQEAAKTYGAPTSYLGI